MEYRRLGKSGLKLSVFSFGSWVTFSRQVDGKQALEIFSRNPDHFDLLVTDQTMPNMTGEGLVRKLLALRGGLPVILCTGNSESVFPGSGGSVRYRGLLRKPIAPSELARVVGEVLGAAQEISPAS